MEVKVGSSGVETEVAEGARHEILCVLSGKLITQLTGYDPYDGPKHFGDGVSTNIGPVHVDEMPKYYRLRDECYSGSNAGVMRKAMLTRFQENV